jgi:methylenetetrahydrofolate dehydrogenase (NADP+)/methenyltetrahydrofolate cyclohydrolase
VDGQRSPGGLKTGVIVLDGAALARGGAANVGDRAAAVAERRGRPPRLLLVAFGDGGHAPHVDRKVRAGARMNAEIVPLILPLDSSTAAARASVAARVGDLDPDAVFLQFPFPIAIEADQLAAAVPEALDVDVMTPGRVERYFAGDDDLPPVTVTAALELLAGYAVDVRGLDGVVVAEASPFASMFREALARSGARMSPLISPDADGLADVLHRFGLVVVAAARPRLVRSTDLAPGTIAIDVGYFNPGAVGDIDMRDGVGHLAAIAPVPGGIGPMTIHSLIERTVAFAEAGAGTGAVSGP